jgi:hypothetical protein
MAGKDERPIKVSLARRLGGCRIKHRQRGKTAAALGVSAGKLRDVAQLMHLARCIDCRGAYPANSQTGYGEQACLALVIERAAPPAAAADRSRLILSHINRAVRSESCYSVWPNFDRARACCQRKQCGGNANSDAALLVRSRFAGPPDGSAGTGRRCAEIPVALLVSIRPVAESPDVVDAAPAAAAEPPALGTNPPSAKRDPPSWKPPNASARSAPMTRQTVAAEPASDARPVENCLVVGILRASLGAGTGNDRCE